MESELSSVIDEPPKKRQKKQEKVCFCSVSCLPKVDVTGVRETPEGREVETRKEEGNIV